MDFLDTYDDYESDFYLINERPVSPKTGILFGPLLQ